MKIQLHNVDDADRHATSGPNVEFRFSDKGQSNVSITLRISDGTVFQFPRSMAPTQTDNTFLPKGRYRCVVAILAVHLETFPKNFDAQVHINGKLVVSAKGAIPEGQEVDKDFEMFSLVVE